jgi:hypothetical protein
MAAMGHLANALPILFAPSLHVAATVDDLHPSASLRSAAAGSASSAAING